MWLYLPHGSSKALLSCKDVLNGGFKVINTDDYYGKDAYRQVSTFLDSLNEKEQGHCAVAGFYLENTLSEHGGVTRGLCAVDDEGNLTAIKEKTIIPLMALGFRQNRVCKLLKEKRRYP